MITKYKKYVALFFIAVVFPLSYLLASSGEAYVQTLSGKIKKGDSCTVIDDKFVNLPLDQWNQLRNLSVENVISFEIRHDTSLFYQTKSFSCILNLSIKYFTSRDQETPTEINDVKLTVNYDTTRGKSFHSLDQYRFKNAYKVIIVVNSITSKEWGKDLPAIFRLKNQIFIDRQYPFNQQSDAPFYLRKATAFDNINNDSYINGELQSVSIQNFPEDVFQLYPVYTPPPPGIQNANNQVVVTWDPANFGGGQDEYDIEWTYVDAQSDRGLGLASEIAHNELTTDEVTQWMLNDNTRVTIKIDNTPYSYSIDLPYQDGFILVRMRGVTYETVNGAQLRKTTDWKYQDAGGNINYMAIDAQSPNLNWQYTAVYAEEGKRKEIITYFDGSQRSRQSVTIINNNNVSPTATDNVAVAAETIYDNMGRGALSVLPAPVDDKILGFHPGLTLNSHNSPYSQTDITPTGTGCSIVGDLMSTNSGAAQYYSPNNSFLNDAAFTTAYSFNKYLPDAGQYPYTLTEYTSDNTGHIRTQSGVGASLRMGAGHETKYYYGKPMQDELDRLFGMEVGSASHYLKNMIKDPNGQLSVSYVDANGRTIATALAGGTPDALDAIPGNTTARTSLNQTLMRASDFSRDETNFTIKSTATFLAVVTGSFTLSYTIDPTALTTTPTLSHTPCPTTNDPNPTPVPPAPAFCSNCYYEVEVEIKDQCGGTVLPLTHSTPFLINNTTCSTLTPLTTPISFQVNEIGEYTVTYTLKLSKDDIQYQEDYYINHNSDLLTLQDYLQTQLNQLDLSGCYSDCSTCKAALGTEQEFTQKVQALFTTLKQENLIYNGTSALDLTNCNIQNWIQTTYNNLYNHCVSASCTAEEPPCEQRHDMMKADVRPGGQYALYNTSTDPTTGSTVYAYIERTINVLRFYNDASVPAISTISFVANDGTTKQINQLSESDFIAAYLTHPEWADQFVTQHPEDCGYQFCLANSDIYTFEQTVRDAVNAGQDAVSLGYYDRTHPYAIMAKDPFFTTAPGNSLTTIQAMQSDLDNISAVLHMSDGANLTTKGIFDLIDWELYCRPTDGSTSNWSTCSVSDPNCRSLNQEWQLYKNYYLQLRSKYIAIVKNPTCNNCFIGGDAFTTNSCNIGPLSDYSIIAVKGLIPFYNCFAVYQNQTHPFPDDFTINWSATIISGGIPVPVTGTATAHKGDTRVLLHQAQAPLFGTPSATAIGNIVSVDCLNPTPLQACAANPSSAVSCPLAENFDATVEAQPGQSCPASGSGSAVSVSYKTGATPALPFPSTEVIGVNVQLTVEITDPDTHEVHDDVASVFISIDPITGKGSQCMDFNVRALTAVVTSPVSCSGGVPSAPVSSCTSDPRYTLYKNKIRIWEDYSNTDAAVNCNNGSGLNLSDPATATAQSLQQLRDAAMINLAAMKDNWINTLRSMVKDEDDLDRQNGVTPRFSILEDDMVDANGNPGNSTITDLVNNLYLVAAKYIQIAPQENIRPASTLPPGYVADGTSYTSFADVFNDIGPTLENLGFNQYLLSNPYPYDKTPFSVSPVITEIDPNGPVCSNISTLLTRYNSSGSTLSFNDYLKSILGDYVLTADQLTDLQNKCAATCPRKVLNDPLALPIALAAPSADQGWQSCANINGAISDFNTAYPVLVPASPTDIPTKLYRILLDNYLNDRFGFALGFDDYMVFRDACAANSMAFLYNKAATPLVEPDYFACAANLISNGFLTAGQEYNRYISIERANFRNSLVSACMGTDASAKIQGDQYEYHYTLFYYDQSGDLIKTIPPEGVKLLTPDQVTQLQALRTSGTVQCDGSDVFASSDMDATFNNLSAGLQDGSAKSIEMWMYSPGSTSRQVRFVTPDQQYMYQAAIDNNKLWVELYSLQPGFDSNGDPDGSIDITLTNQAYADVSSIAPLQDWTHLVVQPGISSGSLTGGDNLQLYLDGIKLTTITTGAAMPPYPFDWAITANPDGSIPSLPNEEVSILKQVRAYKTLATDNEILADYKNACLSPVGRLSNWNRNNPPDIQNNPLSVWGKFSSSSFCAVTSQINIQTIANQAALDITGNPDPLSSQQNWISDVSNTFTVELWVKPRGTNTITLESQQSNTANIAGVETLQYAIYPTDPGTGTGTDGGMGVAVGTNGVCVVEYSDNYLTPTLVWIPSTPITGWAHVAIIYNNKIPTLYINGKMVKTGLPSSMSNVYPSFNFGGGEFGYINGSIDEVRIWNLARTNQNILDNYQSSIVPGNVTGLTGYWPMSGNSAIIQDFSCRNRPHAPFNSIGNESWQTTDKAPINDYEYVENVSGRIIVPDHTLPSTYVYNSQNQVIQKTIPDAGVSQFWYDRMSRLAVSQNAEQNSPTKTTDPANRYSYTQFDALGRITEAGEKLGAATMTEDIARDNTPGSLASWLVTGTNQQVTQTAYDAAPTWVVPGLTQLNLRKRAAAIQVLEDGIHRTAASYYSYDFEGNVSTLVQENTALKNAEQAHISGSNGLKKIDYEYDLISGKVNKVKYQDGKWDQFYYLYKYDGDNRITEAYSGRVNSGAYPSTNNLTLEASYKYYLHGPQVRIELGKNKLQGLDYAYTLQGWLKGVNGQFLDPAMDMGNDGQPGGGAYGLLGQDAIAFSLGYFNNDYTAIGAGANAFAKPFSSSLSSNGADLFNGNISYSTYAIMQLDGSGPVANTYRYDQLNRLVSANRHDPLSNNSASWQDANGSALDPYKEQVTYDANGNIKTYLRNGAAGAVDMDHLTYAYNVDNNGRLVNNRLRHVNDVIIHPTGQGDIGDQPTDNNSYDKIGNLIGQASGDQGESTTIQWNVYGKINQVNKSNQPLPVTYGYDVAGNRITKSAGAGTTFYVRDAQGGVLGVYGLSGSTYGWNEQDLYGSSRLGMLTPHFNITGTLGSDAYNGTGDHTEDEGNRIYELSNHLGNVIATIDDRPIPVSNSGVIQFYQPDMISGQDYYPFGMVQPGRSYSFATNPYRYGFNGKENDDDIDKGAQDYGMRIYDSRIAKFLTVDPLTTKYPYLTPYQFASNSPIGGIDEDGLEWSPSKDKKGNVIGYSWVGYDNAGRPKDGSVASASYDRGDGMFYYSSDANTRSGSMAFIGKNSGASPSGTFGTHSRDATTDYNYIINFQGHPSIELHGWSWSIDATAFKPFAKGLITKTVGLGETYAARDHDGLRDRDALIQASMAFGFWPKGDAITAVYPEAIFVPLPKVEALAEIGGTILGLGDRMAFGPQTGRLFWAGGGMAGPAYNEAMAFAEQTGSRTLEMTRAGKVLGFVTKKIGMQTENRMRDWMYNMWKWTSKQWASGALGDVHAFIDVIRADPGGVFYGTEKIVLEKSAAKGAVNIVPHAIAGPAPTP